MLVYGYVVLCILLFQVSDGQVNDLKCDFVNKLCKWKADGLGKYGFIKGKQRDMAPLADGPLGSPDSKGSFIQLKERRDSLVSPEVKIKLEFCLSFYYYLFGTAKGEITVLKTNRLSGNSEVLYFRDQDHENIDKWHHFQRTIASDRAASYLYYTINTKREDGTQIAFYKINAFVGKCKTDRYYCDFDTNSDVLSSCPWVTFTTSDESFSWTTVVAKEKYLEIDKDHSSRSSRGGYLTAKDYKTAPVGTSWTIYFPVASYLSPKHCLSFWVYQNSYVKLSLYEQGYSMNSSPTNITVWESTESDKPFWVRKMFTVTRYDTSAVLNVFLEMKKLENSDTPIGIDSILYTDGECPKPATCDFDENFCGFESSESRWLIGRGRVAKPENLGDSFTPPVTTSRYAYVDMSLSLEKQTAILRSDEVTPGDYCLSWNEFHSKYTGHSFEIHVATSKGDTLFKAYELVNSNDLGTWTSKSKSISASQLKEDFRLLFVVDSKLGFTALDGVELSVGKCSTDKEEEFVIDPIEETSGSCDFENGMCLWKNLNGQDVGLWKIGHQEEDDANLPDIDATLRTTEGHFVYFKAENENGEQATLNMQFSISPGTPAGKYCIALQSVIRGAGAANLTINFEGTGTESSIAVKPTITWHPTQAEFELSDESSPLDIKLVAYASGNSAVSVDNIEIYKGQCRPMEQKDYNVIYSCGFREDELRDDSCGINVDTVKQDVPFLWSYEEVETRHFSTGYALSVGTSNPSASGSSRFYLPRLKPKEKTCLTFWYLMGAKERITLRISLEKGYELEDDDQTSDVILEISENNGGNWNPARVDIDDERQWRLAFEVEIVNGTEDASEVAVRDILVTRGACPLHDSCNFDDDSCLWHNIKKVTTSYSIEATNLWSRHSTEMVNDSLNLPKLTAEGKQGSYLFTGGKTGNALLLSPRFDWPSSEEVQWACFTFWHYSMIDEEGGAVFLSNKLTDTATALNLFKSDNSPSDQWVKKRVQISRSDSKSFWLVIRAKIENPQSFHALDDIRLEFNKCQDDNMQFICDYGATILSTDRVCNFIYDCEDKTDEKKCGYACDFANDENLCGWSAAPSGAWKVTTPPYQKSQLVASKISPSSKATFESPIFKQSMSSCQVSFRTTFDPKQAKVVAEISVESQNNVEIWSSEYSPLINNLNDPVLAKFIPGKIDNEFRITISVIASSHLSQTSSDTAIWNIEFSDNCFVEKHSNEPCPSQSFKCKNGRCIDESEICNSRDECGDNSDESDDICKNRDVRFCDFRSLCFFTDKPKTKYFPMTNNLMTGFVIRQGFDQVAHGPTRDNTDNSKSGWFAYLPGSANSGYRETSLVAEHTLSACASFFVFSRGEVTLLVNSQIMPIYDEPIWRLQYVDGLRLNEPLIITATTSSADSYLAIDDFSWGTKCRSQPVIRPTRGPTTQHFEIDSTTVSMIVKTSSAPTTIETPGQRKFHEVNFICQESSGRVPRYSICDDVLDCLRGEDETELLCGQTKCAYSGIYCQLKETTKFGCLNENELLCDGKADCMDESDEDPRLCNPDAFCDGWCQRGGICNPKDGRLDSCSCPDPYYGKRCQYPDIVPMEEPTTKLPVTPISMSSTKPPDFPQSTDPRPTEDSTESATPRYTDPSGLQQQDKNMKTSSNGPIGLLAFTVIIIVASTVAGYIVYKKRLWSGNKGGNTGSLSNFAYDAHRDEVTYRPFSNIDQ